jgi:hypothetical protein
MIAALRHILEKALERLGSIVIAYLPPLLAAIAIFLAAFLIAIALRWALSRMIKAPGFDRFLSQSGLSSMVNRSGRLRATRLVAGTVYWAILLIGALTALSAFNTALTTRMVETVIFLLPKLLTAGAIILAGVWLGQYLGRSVVVWGCNEGIPYARTLAVAVRLLVVFVAVVVAADHLDFARNVFLAAFIMLVGGLALAASIAVGISAHHAFDRHLEKTHAEKENGGSLWNHL